MTRTRIGLALSTAVLGLVGLVGLAACGRTATNASDAVDVPANLSAEGQALAAMGFDTADLTTDAQVGVPATAPSGSPSIGPSTRAQHGAGPHRIRVFLRRNVLHGEAVVQTKDGGAKTIAVQRGTVTAVTSTTMTVKSNDGFTQTWTFGNPIHVVQNRAALQPSDIKVGAGVGVAGPKDNGAYTARLIVIPTNK